MKAGDSRHPCFTAGAHGTHARIHLPVAAACNIRCGYCDRRHDCVNESRPGVTSRVLDPTEAAQLVDRAVAALPHLSVVGIAGPGDPL
ncbi:radical SAM protein, partial [Desulfovibrio oxamicus]|nr:radical SAM protein [Nitratidesulfovibrio oxamicus]